MMALFSKMQKQAGNIMAPFAELLLRQAHFPPPVAHTGEKFHVLDNACGAGTVSKIVVEVVAKQDQSNNMALTCADLSDWMIDGMNGYVATNGWKQVEAIKTDAQVRTYSP